MHSGFIVLKLLQMVVNSRVKALCPESSSSVWQEPLMVSDGRLITGQNGASAPKVANKVLEAFEAERICAEVTKVLEVDQVEDGSGLPLRTVAQSVV